MRISDEKNGFEKDKADCDSVDMDNVMWKTHWSQMETLNQTPSQIDLLTKTKLM